MNTGGGAQASAVIYSVTETARANGLNIYYYMRHLLTELPQMKDGGAFAGTVHAEYSVRIVQTGVYGKS